ncbi:MBL fold metallo-hydrolase [Portibacter marinus]|uniref:MBL fold metallo-hydrolase n=1 Tax=Portibacter marinus TaxID=2898660 RepID=UPI001F3AC21D|nr:MBL fold metallo-hydrolase [Portibacter marinus]
MSHSFLILIFFIAILAISCATMRVPTYEGEVSDHFDGRRFFNPDGPGMGNFWKLMKYNRKHQKGEWNFQNAKSLVTEEISDFNQTGSIRYFYINHATVLIQIDGVNILTDPVYSQRASPFEWAGPKRYRNPAITFELLPRIDAVLISHDHYDHLDVKTLKRLRDRDNPVMYVGLGLKNFLKRFKLNNVIELDWDQKHSIKGVEIVFTEAIHWSNRAFSPRKTLWGGYVIKGSASTYFAGDTAYGAHFTEAKKKYGPFDLALIPIGAYVPRFFMLHVHMDPQQGLQTHRDLDPGESLAIHWGTFPLTHESMFDPVQELQTACDSVGIENFYFDMTPGIEHITSR